MAAIVLLTFLHTYTKYDRNSLESTGVSFTLDYSIATMSARLCWVFVFLVMITYNKGITGYVSVYQFKFKIK